MMTRKEWRDYVKKCQLDCVDPHKLKDAPWNPSGLRTSLRNNSFRKLVKSVGKYGQIVPAIVTDQMFIVEGHRRIAAAIYHNRDVFCVIIPHEETELLAEKYVETNGNMKIHTSAEKLQSYMIDPKSVPSGFRRTASAIEALIGRTKLEKFTELNIGLRTLSDSVRIYDWLQDNGENSLDLFAVMWWAVTQRQVRNVMDLRRLGKVTPAKVKSAIVNGIPLR